MIKFRGRDIEGVWRVGSLITEPVGMMKDTPIIVEDGTMYVVDGATVGQFTGLTDKNGKEIYEGDIIREYITSRIMCGREVRYYNGAFLGDSHAVGGESSSQNYDYVHERYQTLKYFADTDTKLEVIGNIHDNPELIKN